MGRIVLAAVLAGWGTLVATPGVAQTNEACMLRCLDHLLYQACHARCTKGEPAPSRAATPTNVPPAAATPPSPPAAGSPPLFSAQPAPAPQPSAVQPTVAQPAPQPTIERTAQPAANQAPSPRAPQQSVKPPEPPARPVNEMCVLRCLDHGRLDQQCQAICAK